MLSGVGLSGILIIAIVALVLFGPNKLPQLGRAIGTTLSEFRNGTKSLMDSHDDASTNKDKRKDETQL
ncbi:Sec-independent protein translocase protein TatAd [compost metagenome]